MASIPLRFVPPDIDNLTTLKVWEGSVADGAFVLIDTVTDIGEYPNYITEWTTQNANLVTDWFAISWVDDGDAESPLSAPIQGGTTTLVAKLIQRVRERNRNVDINVVQQEAEAVLQTYFGDTADPYDVTLTANYKILNGLTYMTLARTLMAELLSQTEVNQATVGLVSFKSATGQNTLANIQELIDMAERDLGIGGSVVLDLDRLCITYGGPDWQVLRQLLYTDQELAYIPYMPWPIERVGKGKLRSTR
jgi:hypothetical protein